MLGPLFNQGAFKFNFNPFLNPAQMQLPGYQVPIEPPGPFASQEERDEYKKRKQKRKSGVNTETDNSTTGSIFSDWLDKSGENQKKLMTEYMQQAGKLQSQNRIYSNFNNFAQSFGKGQMLKADAYANMSNRMANVTNSIKYTGAGTRPVVFPSFRYF